MARLNQDIKELKVDLYGDDWFYESSVSYKVVYSREFNRKVLVMTSYADVAASSNANGVKNAESKTDKGAEKLNQKTAKGSEEAEELAKNAGEKFESTLESGKKNIKDLGNGKPKRICSDIVQIIKDGVELVRKNIQKASSKLPQVTSAALARTGTEVQNPVVLTQSLVGLGGLAAGYVLYTERSRIDTKNNYVLAIHGSILTGLVLLDAFLFKIFYPRYKK